MRIRGNRTDKGKTAVSPSWDRIGQWLRLYQPSSVSSMPTGEDHIYKSTGYKKNDNCYVEQKNYSVVRRAVGYHHYETEAE